MLLSFYRNISLGANSAENVQILLQLLCNCYLLYFFRASLSERLSNEDTSVRLLGSVGNREMTFSTRKKKNFSLEEKNRRHREERKRLVRPVHGIKSKFKSKFGGNRR